MKTLKRVYCFVFISQYSAGMGNKNAIVWITSLSCSFQQNAMLHLFRPPSFTYHASCYLPGKFHQISRIKRVTVFITFIVSHLSRSLSGRACCRKYDHRYFYFTFTIFTSIGLVFFLQRSGRLGVFIQRLCFLSFCFAVL